MIFDPTITFGNLVEIGSIIGGGMFVLLRLSNGMAVLKSDVSSMQRKIAELAEVMTKQAVLDTRMLNVEQDMRDLRHGKGFVRGPQGIDREYI